MVEKNIQFLCDYTNDKNYTLQELLKFKFYDLVREEDEATFTILVSGKVFFHTEGFNVLEFLQQIALWESTKRDFKYICVDTDENPLIYFVEANGMYTIHSPWQKFNCLDKFSFSELFSVKEILCKDADTLLY